MTEEPTLRGTALKELLQSHYARVTQNAKEAQRLATDAEDLFNRETAHITELNSAEAQLAADLRDTEARLQKLQADLQRVREERKTATSLAERNRADKARYEADHERFTVDVADAEASLRRLGIELPPEQPPNGAPAAPFGQPPAGPTRQDVEDVYRRLRDDLDQPAGGPNGGAPPQP